ncbi:MAG TPA: MarR family winged helix-turn-helix transcriptional regulator [Devosia sp.]|nr:MarR family winged helix-turn-helix transcriptional regulator [Devosia sp.]
MDDPCICISLRQASRRLTALYDAALLPAGLNLAQYSLLRNIDRHAPVSLTRLGEVVELDRSTLGRNARVLERLGLVAMGTGRDAREAGVRLTEAGQASLQRSIPLWSAAQADIRGRLGGTGVAQLETLLGAL